MNLDKAVTYGLLAHIRNSGTFIKGPIDVFIPLVKRLLYKLNSEGITKGESLMEIKNQFDKVYQIDMPVPVLLNILKIIEAEFSGDSNRRFVLYKDKAFQINNYIFDDFEESVQKSKENAQEVQKLFLHFCELNKYSSDNPTTIFDFIDKSKVRLGRYLSNLVPKNGDDFTIEAQFVLYFKNIPTAYELIRKIYLGSILSCYLEYKTNSVLSSVELLFDTNFLISLLDLNTVEATHTSHKLLDVGRNQGYRFSVLPETIKEAQQLLKRRAQNFNNVFLQALVNPEDIYNACDRRNLTRSDLERIADNLETELEKLDIKIIALTSKYTEKAIASTEYTSLKKVRESSKSALHDATALAYVKEKRLNKKIINFEDAKCWFVHNSNTSETENKYNQSTVREQKYTIKADELLNILWLSSPSIGKSLTENDVTDIGLSALVAFTLNESLPRPSVIRELDDNIQKYRNEEITDQDILLISTRVVNHQLKDVEQLNELANKPEKSEFVNRLKAEADIERQEKEKREQQFEQMLSKFRVTVEAIQKKEENLDAQAAHQQLVVEEKIEVGRKLQLELEAEKERNRNLENRIRAKARAEFIARKLSRWRWRTIWYLLTYVFIVLSFIIYVLYSSSWDAVAAAKTLRDIRENLVWDFILTLGTYGPPIFIGILLYKYHNHSSIEKWKDNLAIPDDLQNLS